MLYLLFELGENRFAIEATRVVEVLPLLEISKVPHAPKGVAGFFNCRGTLVPVLDLAQLITPHASEKRLSTRIILVSFVDQTGASRFAGLIAEQATRTVQKDRSQFVQSGIATKGMSFVGPVAIDEKGFIHLIDPEKLLVEHAQELLAFLPKEAST
ncbi:MAG: cheW-like domain protein [Verrucomicrobiales bacterium]|nr:cheW-like domain protein [Verrucomicrobiales bacterium]